MSGKLLLIALAALVLFGAAQSLAATEADLPSPRGSVNDFSGRLNASEKAALSSRLDHYRRISGHDIVVVLVDTPAAADYSDALFTFWRQGRPTLENGLLLLIGNDNDVRAKVGSRLKPPLTRGDKAELTKKLDMTGGRQEGAAIIKRIDVLTGVLEQVPKETRDPLQPWQARMLVFLFFVSMLLVPWLAAIMTRDRQTYGGTYTALVMALMMTIMAGPGVGAAVLALLTPLAFLMDRSISRHYAASRAEEHPPSWWAGGRRYWG